MRTLTNTAPDTRDLARRVLAANVAFCLVSGAGMAVLANPLGGWIGAPAVALLVVGLGLIPWGAMLWFFSRRDVIKKAQVWLVIAGDELWAIATLILIFGFPSALNSTGRGVAAMVGLVVAGFATGQFIGIRRLDS